MWIMHRSVRFAGACTCLFVAVLAGCSKEIWITQYPVFYQKGKIKSVAVLPFKTPGNPGSQGGRIIADGLATALTNSGTYKRVYNYNHLSALLQQHDLKDLFSDTPSTKGLTALRNATNVDAIIVGSVSTYSATTRNERKQRPVYGTDVNGNTVIVGYKKYILSRNEANVSVTAALLRTSDGSTIYALPAPATGRAAVQGSPPRYDRNACLSYAVDQVVRQLLLRFAVVRRRIRVDPKRALRTATGRYDGKWEDTEEFSVRSDMMLVVVDLPTVCDRNRFRLVIVREDSREVLAEQELVWSARNSGRGQSYKFNPSEIAKRGGGPGEYVVKFYSGEEPVITRDFEIVP